MNISIVPVPDNNQAKTKVNKILIIITKMAERVRERERKYLPIETITIIHVHGYQSEAGTNECRVKCTFSYGFR